MASSDYPPNSRLFLLCSSSFTEADIRNEFGKFGRIDDCWFVHDKTTHKSKGVCYIKYSKASEACRALEEMDNKPMLNERRPIKVKMACPVQVGNRRESDVECLERLRCAFVRVPKRIDDGSMHTEETIKHTFEQYGTVIGCNFTRTRKNCYVTFDKASQASLAIEECPREFAAVFVDPQKSSLLRKRSPDRSREHNRSPSPPTSHPRRPPLVQAPPAMPYPRVSPPLNHYSDRQGPGILPLPCAPVTTGLDDVARMMTMCSNNPSRCQEIYVKINYPISRETAWRLCNLVPALEGVQMVKTVGENSQLHTIFLVRYSTAASAGWAWEKMQDLEYPPGAYIRVRYADAGFPKDWDLSCSMMTAATSVPTPVPAPSVASLPDYCAARIEALHDRLFEQPVSLGGNVETSILSSLVNTLSAAAAASPSVPAAKTYLFNGMECSVKLSYPKALLPKTTPYEARLFYLNTKPIGCDILEDIFSSFGDLISVFAIPGKNCGYVMYASKRAAEVAMMTLNNAVVGGAKLKILQADSEPPSKRSKTEQFPRN